MKNKTLLYVCIGLLLSAIGVWVYYIVLTSAIRDSVEQRSKYEAELTKKLIDNLTANNKIDSLFKINTELSKYKTLTQAMLHRDESTSQLKHKIGDVVYMKNDSSRVIVEDVLIGGGKYDYYVKFRVLFKDNTTKEVKPELIY